MHLLRTIPSLDLKTSCLARSPVLSRPAPATNAAAAGPPVPTWSVQRGPTRQPKARKLENNKKKHHALLGIISVSKGIPTAKFRWHNPKHDDKHVLYSVEVCRSMVSASLYHRLNYCMRFKTNSILHVGKLVVTSQTVHVLT